MTTVLITGITGQDGSLMARQVAGEGLDVHGLALEAPQSARWRRDGIPGVTVHYGDLADADRVHAVVQDVAPAEIYNLGGVSSVAASWEDPIATARSTGLGALAICEAAQRLQERSGKVVRVLQASSAEVFGRADHSPQDERTPIRPVSPYGAAKAFAHHMAAVYRSRGLHVSTCILFNHESPTRPESFVTRKIAKAAAQIARDGGHGFITLGNLDARRDWGWAADYVDCMIRAARHPVSDDFVVATGVTHSVGDFARIALEHVGVSDWQGHVRVDERFLRPVEATEQVGDAAKAARNLGWTPSVTFEEIVRRMVEHDLAQPIDPEPRPG